jgi:4-diphosphocytidyl-2-C-methyl-D-erythritol kinase
VPYPPFADSSPALGGHVREAPAKLNLGLRVLRRRPDGYHDLETVFVPVGWADRLGASPADGLRMTGSDPDLPTDDGNLVVRAARALAEYADIEAHARLHLEKRVPYGAGLGSGSSDAAAALLLLAGLWGLDVPEADLLGLAAGLGSDVPFFLHGVPALATGRGERLTPLVGADGAPWQSPFWLVVAVPPVHVSTAEAYRAVTPDAAARPDLAAAVTSNDLGRWRREVANDFEGPVVARYPEVGSARDALLSAGAGYAAMSGSGSAVFGAFENGDDARAAAERLAASGRRTWTEPPAASP